MKAEGKASASKKGNEGLFPPGEVWPQSYETGSGAWII